ncbi:MAG TPA: hydrogenase maturation nickel metallochaperone HypA [Polyangiaceae bacterium]|nr:hydrogenase maturation nickel metallochaperone HypA [Polyangiaceae bacterium]
MGDERRARIARLGGALFVLRHRARLRVRVVAPRGEVPAVRRTNRFDKGLDGTIAETDRVSPESIAFHFRALAQGATAEGAALELDLHHVEVRCDSCGTTFAPDDHVRLCPSCGSARGASCSGPRESRSARWKWRDEGAAEGAGAR